MRSLLHTELTTTSQQLSSEVHNHQEKKARRIKLLGKVYDIHDGTAEYMDQRHAIGAIKQSCHRARMYVTQRETRVHLLPNSAQCMNQRHEIGLPKQTRYHAHMHITERETRVYVPTFKREH